MLESIPDLLGLAFVVTTLALFAAPFLNRAESRRWDAQESWDKHVESAPGITDLKK